jgi:hypothetical protein
MRPWLLAERPDSWLVEPSRIAVADRLRAAMIGGLHGVGEVTNDLAKIHNPEVTTLRGPQPLNPRIKRKAQSVSKPPGIVRCLG